MATPTIAVPAAKQVTRSVVFALLIASVVLVAIVATALALHGSAGHVVAHFPPADPREVVRYGRPQ